MCAELPPNIRAWGRLESSCSDLTFLIFCSNCSCFIRNIIKMNNNNNHLFKNPVSNKIKDLLNLVC